MPLRNSLRSEVAAARQGLRAAYFERPNPAQLLRRHARLVDRTVRSVWRQAGLPAAAALVATGGYGRGELYPSSDIDLLVLLAAEPDEAARASLERLIGTFWDIGLEIGHSVRTLEACLEVAAHDITVRTALLEARYLAGSRSLYKKLTTRLQDIADPRSFFEAKKLEQEQRHAKHQDSPYSLEPNLKEAPGGLRDLHVIQWIARACAIGRRWSDLVAHGLIERDEARQLARHEALLQDLRIRLHYLAGRREDRIVFDFQGALAAQLGYAETAERRASEAMMQRYYRTAKAVTQLNTIVLQNLEARLLPQSEAASISLNERFRVRGELLEVADERLFESAPTAILESFLLLMQHQELRGMTAPTLRALYRSRFLIDSRFRKDPLARLLFVHILQQQRGIVHEFRRMNQYGILGRYLPEFGRIVGQMQHDLFHVYTVDQHILMVVRNLRRFTMPEFAHEFPLCSELMSGFERRWLLYVAALYHDIAKGRGGDHSALGARDVRNFSRRHGLASEDRELIDFLVEQHLAMSQVAQKQDVHDPEVVQAFARRVGSERRLVALYLFSVADVRGTSPKVWNAWKAKLLEDLFRAARRVLTGELLARDAALAEKQAEARRLLRLYALSDGVESRLWEQLDTAYFLRHDAQEIAWQTRNLHYRVDAGRPVVKARLAPFGEGLQVMIYCRDREALFARICGYFERSAFNIVEAKVHTTRNGYALDTFLVMGQGRGAHYRDMIGMIEAELAEEVESQAPLAPPRGGRLSRRVRHFPISPAVDIRPDERGAYHVLSIVASDRPGLLYGVARILARYRINLQTARINTLGDRAEDVFLIAGNALADPKAVLQLEQDLLKELSLQEAAPALETAPR
ncbi:MAG: [protein-PII] uridylyltransferase [Betaproteobacteria bacterium RIFCSPLOWO2_12_FULL_68_19]|nr:MAG: [protein-PII] uridylyltransferase [Betaproteobacteria bacterium RIFCSPLOWO2_12_FULL_68_19]